MAHTLLTVCGRKPYDCFLLYHTLRAFSSRARTSSTTGSCLPGTQETSPLAPGHIYPEGPMDAVISAPNQLLHADEHSLFIRCIARSGPQATHTPTRRQILPVIGSVSSGRPRRTHSELRSARAASPPYRPLSQRSGACRFTPIEPIVPRAPQLAPEPCPSPSPACRGGSHICEAPF